MTPTAPEIASNEHAQTFRGIWPTERATVAPYYSEGGQTILHGDALAVLATLDANHFDTVITDPPYHLKSGGAGGFMGKAWDGGDVAFRSETWAAVMRVCKPGAFLLAFGGTRTFHRMACAIEDAGWELRDTMMWLYGSGFPKSLDISKAIDKAAGAVRDLVGVRPSFRPNTQSERDPEGFQDRSSGTITAPATDAAKLWTGWGTALKPSFEPLIVARKPETIDKERRYTVGNLYRLEAQLWSLLPASIAETCFGLSPAEHGAACATAQWSAEHRRSTWDDLFGRMDTSRCVSVMTMCLNTVRSWSGTLAENSELTNTFTTGTKPSLTIDWKTLKSCASDLTPSIIIKAEIQLPGSASTASSAASYLNAVAKSISATRELFALESAIAQGHTSLPDDRGEGLSPNFEPIIVAMKPLDGTFAENAQRHGVAGLNIDGGRIHTEGSEAREYTVKRLKPGATLNKTGGNWRPEDGVEFHGETKAGRWPANIILDEAAAEVLDLQSGELTSNSGNLGSYAGEPVNVFGKYAVKSDKGRSDSGGASRFFYTAKASKSDRGPTNDHATVKPTALLKYLCKLTATPTGGEILDPFGGSMTTLVAAREMGRPAVAIELEESHCRIGIERLRQGVLFSPEVA